MMERSSFFIGLLVACLTLVGIVVTQQRDVLHFSQDVEHKDKVWLFAVDGRRKPFNFLDESGKLVGFDVDFVTKVCKVARQNCKMVLAQFTECTFSERNINYAGRGLMAEWFDACPGYVSSLDRLGAFDFTQPYLSTYATFTVAPSNPAGFDPKAADFSKFTLTHLTGAVTGTQCLARLQKTFGKVIVAANLPEAKGLLLDGSADVLFSPRSNISGLETLSPRFHCDNGGTAVAFKKGSNLAAWWDPAFEKLVASGGFKQLCDEGELKYGTNLRCLPKSHIVPNRPKPMKPKVNLFGISGRRKPFAFQNDVGKIDGFNVDLVHAVCAEANQACDFVLTAFTECSFTDRDINYAGRGLMEGWFTACPGYADSLDRANAVDFTDAFLPSGAHFAVKPGNPKGFDPDADDFSQFTISHLTGAYTNAECLTRLKKKFGAIVVAANLPEAKALLFNGTVDVIFAPRSAIPDLEVLPQVVHCEQSGSSVMVKKGGSLVGWWNKAFRALYNDGRYHKLCEEGSVKYNYTITCLP